MASRLAREADTIVGLSLVVAGLVLARPLSADELVADTDFNGSSIAVFVDETGWTTSTEIAFNPDTEDMTLAVYPYAPDVDPHELTTALTPTCRVSIVLLLQGHLRSARWEPRAGQLETTADAPIDFEGITQVPGNGLCLPNTDELVPCRSQDATVVVIPGSLENDPGSSSSSSRELIFDVSPSVWAVRQGYARLSSPDLQCGTQSASINIDAQYPRSRILPDGQMSEIGLVESDAVESSWFMTNGSLELSIGSSNEWILETASRPASPQESDHWSASCPDVDGVDATFNQAGHGAGGVSTRALAGGLLLGLGSALLVEALMRHAQQFERRRVRAREIVSTAILAALAVAGLVYLSSALIRVLQGGPVAASLRGAYAGLLTVPIIAAITIYIILRRQWHIGAVVCLIPQCVLLIFYWRDTDLLKSPNLARYSYVSSILAVLLVGMLIAVTTSFAVHTVLSYFSLRSPPRHSRGLTLATSVLSYVALVAACLLARNEVTRREGSVLWRIRLLAMQERSGEIMAATASWLFGERLILLLVVAGGALVGTSTWIHRSTLASEGVAPTALSGTAADTTDTHQGQSNPQAELN